MKKNILLLTIFYFSNSFTYSQCWQSFDVKGDTNSVQFAIRSDGTLWDLTPGIVPYQIGNDNDWDRCFSSWSSKFGIKTDSTLWGWGNNYFGELGINSTTPVLSPILLNSDKWIDVASSCGNTMAIKSDRTLWFWGNTSQLTPIQIGTDNDWQKVHADFYVVMAIKTDGTLWKGVPGNILTQIGTDNDWNFIWVNEFEWYGIKNNGTLWNDGVQIGTDSDWESIVNDKTSWPSSTYAIKNNNTLWYWSGSTVITPTQLNASQSWDQIGVNYLGVHYAIESTGEYWLGNIGDSLLPSTLDSLCSFLSYGAINDLARLEAYPNPNTGQLYLKLNQYEKQFRYSVIDIRGRIVLNGVLNKAENFLDLSKINSGIYIIKVENNSPVRIIKQ